MKKVDMLREAKKTFLQRKDIGMCYALTLAYWNNYKFTYPKFSENIPEFNRKFLNPDSDFNNPYWWDQNDIESRIKAFDKLIEIYKDSDEEWIQ